MKIYASLKCFFFQPPDANDYQIGRTEFKKRHLTEQIYFFSPKEKHSNVYSIESTFFTGPIDWGKLHINSYAFNLWNPFYNINIY